VASVEDLEELFRGKTGVERDLEPLMAEELLDVTDIAAVAKKMSTPPLHRNNKLRRHHDKTSTTAMVVATNCSDTRSHRMA
jgi:hypothetical protein